MNETQYGFVREYAFLTNFFHAPIEYEGILYPSTEHAYQGLKSLDPIFRQYIATLDLPGEAKHAGNNKLKGQRVRCVLREDWENVKIQIMEDVCREKFTTHIDLRKKLLDTGNMELIEYNTWHDHFWGKSFAGVGRNELGKVLMKLRAEFRLQQLCE